MQGNEEGEFKKRIDYAMSTLWWGDSEVADKEVLFSFVEDAKKEFPIEFWCAVIGEDEQGETVEEQEIMPTAKLPENRANARINKDKIIDWFVKWFGSVEAKT